MEIGRRKSRMVGEGGRNWGAVVIEEDEGVVLPGDVYL